MHVQSMGFLQIMQARTSTDVGMPMRVAAHKARIDCSQRAVPRVERLRQVMPKRAGFNSGHKLVWHKSAKQECCRVSRGGSWGVDEGCWAQGQGQPGDAPSAARDESSSDNGTTWLAPSTSAHPPLAPQHPLARPSTPPARIRPNKQIMRNQAKTPS